MDTLPHQPDNLSDEERRFAACAPSAAGLDVDAMLFAAGRASVRPGLARFLWPAATLCLTMLAVVLGVWLASERSARLALTQQLRQPPPAPVPTPSPPTSTSDAPADPPPADEPAPNSLLAGHRALEHGLDAWPPQTVARVEAPGPVPPEPRVLHVGSRDTLLDP